MENKKVSIIIVNWNGIKWLEKCLNSLFNQTYKNYEVVFVDNFSNDNSVEYVRRNFPETKVVISDVNLGFAGGNNLGIQNSTGDFLLLLNNDTWVELDFIEKLVASFEKSNLDIASPLVFPYDGRPIVSYKKRCTIDFFGYPVVSKKLNYDFYLPGSCLFLRKSFYYETGGLDNNFFMYFEEIDWFWRMHLMKKNIGILDSTCYFHAGSGSTKGGSIKYNSFLWRNQNILQMLLKNYKVYNLIWVLPVYFLQNIIEIIFFLIILKPGISKSYIEGWVFNFKNFHRTLKARKETQKLRLVSDLYVMKYMYPFIGRFRHLVSFASSLLKL